MKLHALRSMAGVVLVAVIGTDILPAKGSDDGELAQLLIELLRAGRAVVSEHQPLINDASRAEKGFADSFFIGKVIDKFKATTRVDLSRPDGIPQRELLLAMLESEREVVLEAQPIINRQGIAYKGFTHSTFARKVGQKFFAKTGIRIKLTGADYRVHVNKPDDVEAEVLRMFADPRHPKGRPYAKVMTSSGKPVLRVMNPEYAQPTCLVCHGGPKGELDLTGAKKEGWKEGDLAGAISVVLPVH